VLILCSRQAGKSTTAAAIALAVALTEPGSLILLLSPTLRQSGELFRDKLLRLYDALGRPMPAVQRTALTLELANGSRVVSLPESEGNIRGFSGVKLLVIDEATRVGDPLYKAVRPMLAVSQGRLLALTTAWAKQGWFYDAWHGSAKWDRVKVAADQCPRISPGFLAEERAALGPRWYGMEYLCEFADAVESVFSSEDVRAALTPAVRPLFGSHP
jgi:hypothetical protein